MLLACMTIACLAVRFDRLLAAELRDLEARRAAAPHGWIDFNLHHS